MAMERPDTLELAWAGVDALRHRVAGYLQNSEQEFGELIQALEASWRVLEGVQDATRQIASLTAEATGIEVSAMRSSVLEGCAVFRRFLNQIDGVIEELGCTVLDTKRLLNTSNHLIEDLVPLRYIAFNFRLEAARLTAGQKASILQVSEEMNAVLGSMEATGHSQAKTLVGILESLTLVTQSVEQVSGGYAHRAVEGEQKLVLELDRLLEVPRELVEIQAKAKALEGAGAHITAAVKVLQRHDAIRQRLDHIMAALEDVRLGRGLEAGYALPLQRHQAKDVRGIVINAGADIAKELNAIMEVARAMAGSGPSGEQDGHDPGAEFEVMMDRLAKLTTEMTELLAGGFTVGAFMQMQIEPIRGLLTSKGGELEVLARAMKRLALNVIVNAEKMSSAQGISVLGTWTSEAAERMFNLSQELNERFGALGEMLQRQVTKLGEENALVEASYHGLAKRTDEPVRASRRAAHREVGRLGEEARNLHGSTQSLLQSLRFVDDSLQWFQDFDMILEVLQSLYPAPSAPMHFDAADAGYAMREQHAVHAKVFGAGGVAPNIARLAEAQPGEDYGDNVELF